MLKALYDYGLRRQLTLPPGFIEKTVKAYISLSEDNDRVSIYLGDDEQLPCPDMGSLAQGRDKCNVLVEKRSIVIPDAPADGARRQERFLSGNAPRRVGGGAAAEDLRPRVGNPRNCGGHPGKVGSHEDKAG